MQPRTGTSKSEGLVAPSTWMWVLVVGVAFCAFFYHFLLNQIQFSRDPDWSHAYLVPLISVYYIYENRTRILRIPARRNLLGLPLIAMGVGAYFFFALGPTWNHFFQGLALVITLLGVVLLLLGWSLWSALLFPMLYLIMGIRMPPSLLLKITPTLQVWASQGSYYLLNMLRFETEISGTVLTLYHDGETIPLNVAEACSGMRMIVAFLALGIAIAFLSCQKWWQRIALIAMGVPVAIIVNVLRVTSLGIASTANADLATGDAHMYIGMLWLVPAFLLYLGIVWVIQHLFVESETARGADRERSAVRRPDSSADAQSPRRAALWLPLAVTMLFGVGALGFAPAQRLMGIYLHKEPVPLRRQLSELPMIVGSWEAVGTDEIVSQEIMRSFGTDEYLTRNFALDGNPANGVLQLHVSYYTGGIDSVPHIPDRCYVGGGLTKSPTSSTLTLGIDDSLWWDDPAHDPTDPDAHGDPYRMAQTTDPSRQVVRMPRLGSNGLQLNAAEYWAPADPTHTLAAGYLFIANGGVSASSEGVRLLAYDRGSQFAYYCKVQLTLQYPSKPVKRDELAAAASEFLSIMLPDLMACLPDWWEVEHGLWPRERRGAEQVDGAEPIGSRRPAAPVNYVDELTSTNENG